MHFGEMALVWNDINENVADLNEHVNRQLDCILPQAEASQLTPFPHQLSLLTLSLSTVNLNLSISPQLS